MDPRYQELAGRIGLGHSERIANLFAMLADSIDADILLALPAQAPAVADKLGLEPAEVQRRLDDLFLKGVVFTNSKTDPPTYGTPRHLIQFHDASLLWPQAPPEFFDLWRDYMDEEWYDLAESLNRHLDKPHTRVIPVGVSLSTRQQILDFESVREIVENARSLAVTNCTCRLAQRRCEANLERCLQVNKAADYNIARGSGRAIGKEEALEILRLSEEEGLIHVTINKSSVDNFICNCCPCCCQALPVLLERGVRVVDPSRFRAVIDTEACSGCGTCVERCHFRAIEMADVAEPFAIVDGELCMGCGLCLVTCPEEAIGLEEIRQPDFVPGAA